MYHFLLAFICCALAQTPTPPKGFPEDTWYTWAVVSVNKPNVSEPYLIEGQLIAFDSTQNYACRYQEQNLRNASIFRPSDYCDGKSGYHYVVEDATGVLSTNPPCNATIPLPGPIVSPQWPKDFMTSYVFLGRVKVNQKTCNHFYSPSVYGNGQIEFQMDIFTDDDGLPCQITTQTKADPIWITTFAFDGFSRNIPGGIPCDVPELLCVERNWTCSVAPSATPAALQAALSWVCGNEDCSPINPGGSHYQPNTLQAHCDWAFNHYYVAHRLTQGSGACNFSGNAVLTPPSPPSPPSESEVVKRALPEDYPTLFPLFVVCG